MKELKKKQLIMKEVIQYLETLSETLCISTVADVKRVKHLYRCEWCYNNLQHVVAQSKCILEQVVLRTSIQDDKLKRNILNDIANLKF